MVDASLHVVFVRWLGTREQVFTDPAREGPGAIRQRE